MGTESRVVVARGLVEREKHQCCLWVDSWACKTMSPEMNVEVGVLNATEEQGWKG